MEFAEDGEYEFELQRWPKEEDISMTEGIPGEIKGWYSGGRAIDLKTARIKIGEQEQSQETDPDAQSVTFRFSLKAGVTHLQTFFTDADGVEIGAYYVYARRLN